MQQSLKFLSCSFFPLNPHFILFTPCPGCCCRFGCGNKKKHVETCKKGDTQKKWTNFPPSCGSIHNASKQILEGFFFKGGFPLLSLHTKKKKLWCLFGGCTPASGLYRGTHRFPYFSFPQLISLFLPHVSPYFKSSVRRVTSFAFSPVSLFFPLLFPFPFSSFYFFFCFLWPPPYSPKILLFFFFYWGDVSLAGGTSCRLVTKVENQIPVGKGPFSSVVERLFSEELSLNIPFYNNFFFLFPFPIFPSIGRK